MSYDIAFDHRANDLVLDARLVGGVDRVKQQIEITLLTFLGEWFMDVNWGVPVLDKILIKSPRRAEIESIIRAKVADVPGVTAVPRVDVEIDNRTRQARITVPEIETDEGKVDVRVQHG